MAKLLFITVPPPRSGNVVTFLTNLPQISEAAAVYSDIDVVALVDGDEEEVDACLESIRKFGPPIKNIEELPLDGVIHGSSYRRGRFQRHSALFAYVRCRVNTEIANFEFAVQQLSQLPEVRSCYFSRAGEEIVVQFAVPDKRAFDTFIMQKVQVEAGGGIRHTRTYFVINPLHWSKSGVPVSAQEFLGGTTSYPIFMGIAGADLAAGLRLVDRIHRDTGLRIWTFDLLKPSEEWTQEIDKAIDEAGCWLFFVTKSFLDSGECQREFSKIEARNGREKMCCLLVPPLRPEALPHRYQERQVIDCSQFLSYAALVDWLRGII